MITLYNHDTEKWLLGAVMQDADLAARLAALPPDLMHDPANGAIYAAMRDLAARKAPVELQSVADELTRRGKLEAVGGAAYLIACVRLAPTTVSSAHYVGELTRLHRARTVYALLAGTSRALMDGEDADAAVDVLRTNLRALAAPKGGLVDMPSLASLVFDYVEARSRGEGGGLRTWLPDLDAMICGMEGGDLIVIGARPAVGKSAFGMQIALNAATHGARVMICSREMSRIQYALRIASAASGLSGARLRRGKISDAEFGTLADACNQMAALPLTFAFDSANVADLRLQAQSAKDTTGLDLLVVDYLQILRAARPSGQRYVDVGDVSRALKEIALDLQIPVIAMAQVGRQTVSIGGERAPMMPELSDLRESGNIEQDADVVLFLHHPMAASDKSIPACDAHTREALELQEGMQYIVVRVAKQRQGECGSFGVAFDAAHMTYTCIAR